MRLQKWSLCVALALGVGVAAPASASTITLDFEGLKNAESVLNYYNGGLGDGGVSYIPSGPGPAWGVIFADDNEGVLVATTAGGFGSYANLPSGNNALVASPGGTVVNVPTGFTAFSFYYSNQSGPSSVVVYSSLDAAPGTELATMSLAVNYGDRCTPSLGTGMYCTWDQVIANFTGTALSIRLGGTTGLFFDDLTFDMATSDPVPEPASLVLLGTGLAGVLYAARRRRA